jgi:hypothetical protein
MVRIINENRNLGLCGIIKQKLLNVKIKFASKVNATAPALQASD